MDTHTLASNLLRLIGSISLLGEDYSVDRYWLGDGLLAAMGGEERASIGTDVNAEALSVNICLHSTPVALVPFIIRWGPGASSDVLRRSARCTKCGRKGATLQHPVWAGADVGFESFPVGHAR